MTYIIYIMTEISDRDIIKNFLDWGRYHRFSLAEQARLIGRTRAWASGVKIALDDGKEIRLSQPTRDSIVFLLDIK